MTEEINDAIVIEQSSQEVIETPVQERAVHYEQKLAGFWIRFWAYMIDLIVIFSIGGLVIKPFFRLVDIQISNPGFVFFTPYKVVLLLVTLLYFLLMTKFFSQTVGKMIVGIKVVGKDGQALNWGTLVFREVIGRFISKTLQFPYLLVAFTPKKEALHDLFADTYVIYEEVYEKVSPNEVS